jgi:tryptophan synthase alpha chain
MRLSTNSIATLIDKRTSIGGKALIPFITSAYPTDALFTQLVREFISAGADMIEIGIPFSDPMADGPAIQYSSQRVLERGVTIEKTLTSLARMNGYHAVPFIVMSYYNPIHAYGIERFVRDSRESGVGALIIPDLIPEEGSQVEQICAAGGIDLIYLLAPTSDSVRRKLILRRSRGFVYLVSVAGVTGVRRALPENLDGWIQTVKKESKKPLCVGFGISNVQQAVRVCRHADGVVVGSAIVEIIREASASRHVLSRTGTFLRQLRKGLNHV